MMKTSKESSSLIDIGLCSNEYLNPSEMLKWNTQHFQRSEQFPEKQFSTVYQTRIFAQTSHSGLSMITT